MKSPIYVTVPFSPAEKQVSSKAYASFGISGTQSPFRTWFGVERQNTRRFEETKPAPQRSEI